MGDSDLCGASLEDALQLRVSLIGFEPRIWRRVLIPATATLPNLHRVLQQLMLWGNYHLHVFKVGGDFYGQTELIEDELDWRNEQGVEIAQLVSVGDSLEYTYDFGDNWELLIEVEDILTTRFALTFPVCTEGEFSAPPEDVGGVTRFQRFLEALRDPSDEEHEMYVEWSGADYDFARLNLAEINAQLQKIR